jgi:hypothetical protein
MYKIIRAAILSTKAVLSNVFIFLLCLSSFIHASENPPHKPTINQGSGYWDEYYQNTINETSPHNTLLLAHQYFEIEGRSSGLAVDLGTGTGRDALFLVTAPPTKCKAL